MKFALKKTRVAIAITIASISISLGLTYAFATGTQLFLTIKVFSQVFDLVRRYHIEKVDENELLQAAIDGMLSHVDPYSALLIGNDLQQWQNDLQESDSRSISDAIMIGNEIGYLKINAFSANTGEEFNHNLHLLQKCGMKKLIMDLRGNSGGYLCAAVEVCDQLLPGGKTILTVNRRVPASNHVYYSKVKENLQLFPIIVLIDSATASAAEIVAGALQDWDRALIIGNSSAGKGSVQNQFQLSDSVALLLTSALYFLPSGRSIQKDYILVSNNYTNNKSTGLSESSRSKNSPSPLHYFTSSGRPVTGGGGIVPDIFFDKGMKSQNPLIDFFPFDKFTHSDTIRDIKIISFQSFQSLNDTLLLTTIQHFDQAQLLISNRTWVNDVLQPY